MPGAAMLIWVGMLKLTNAMRMTAASTTHER
jgi:hypothetical protein